MAGAYSIIEVSDAVVTLLAPLPVLFVVAQAGAPGTLLLCATLYGVVAMMRWNIRAEPTEFPSVNNHSDESQPHRNGSSVSHVLETPIVAFRGLQRSFVTVLMLTIEAFSLVPVALSTDRLVSLGFEPGIAGILVSVTAVGAIPAAILAGKFESRLSQRPWLLVLLLAVSGLSLFAMSLSSSLVWSLVLLAIFDAAATCVYVAGPALRTRSESTEDLVSISGSMMLWGGVTSIPAGVLVAAMSYSPPALVAGFLVVVGLVVVAIVVTLYDRASIR